MSTFEEDTVTKIGGKIPPNARDKATRAATVATSMDALVRPRLWWLWPCRATEGLETPQGMPTLRSSRGSRFE